MFLAMLAAGSAFIACACLVAWLAGGFRSPVEARLSRLTPSSAGRPNIDAPFSDRVFIPVVDSFVRAVVQILPPQFVARTTRQLLSAGSPMTTQAFFTVVVMSGALLPSLTFLLFARSGSINGTAIFAIIGAGAVGVILPFFWLRSRMRRRKLQIWKQLADAFDMVTVCVEAGLGLDAALRQMASKLKGPLSEEVGLMLRQVGMGRARREALEDMAYRVDITEVTTFVNAIIQAEQLGTSLGRVLRAQAVSLRTRRRQRAEETARKAPVKMVFPLVLFIMPTFFIVTVGPMIVHVTEYLNE